MNEKTYNISGHAVTIRGGIGERQKEIEAACARFVKACYRKERKNG